MKSPGPDPAGAGSVLRGKVAIIGMACIFPGARDLDAYWHNIVSKYDAVTDPPSDSWDPKVFYDPRSTANDRVYCKRGGYLGELARFNPIEHGIMPVTVDGGEPDQWLALQVAHAALADAGYQDRPGQGTRTEVILGKGTYVNRGNMTVGYHGLIVEQVLQVLRTLHPEHSEAEIQAIKQELKASLPPFGAETAPALIGNILAGRIANRLDLMGPSFTVDGACASALLATEIGVRSLLTDKCDLALVGGVHVNTPVPVFGLFCQLGALSRREEIRPFDKDADGTVLGEGLGMVVLKRLDEAEKDSDRIYAVIEGVGTSSDGRAHHVMAPRLEGEELALRRAYEMAGISPTSVALVEAHGTATPVGDAVEIQALRQVFGERNGAPPRCALGSVKSMIGHTMPAAGIASLIKASLALYHKILPPTLHCEEPNPKLELERTPFYINNDARPWIHGREDAPRRAGVNAFGFGGINAHVVLQEYASPDHEAPRRSNLLVWETEVCILEATSREDLLERARRLLHYLELAPQANLKDLAYTLNTELEDRPSRLAIVASSVEDLRAKLGHAIERLGSPQCRGIRDITGIYFFEERQGGKLAFLFPGEGSQYPNMLLDLALHFPEVRASFDLADRAFIDHPRNYLPSDYIFPRRSWPEPERSAMEQRLWRIDGAVEAVLIANWAMLTLLSRLEIRPDAVLGHSTGDYSAMFASGMIDLTDEPGYIQTIVNWNGMHGRLSEEITIPEAGLVAAATDSATLDAILDEVQGEIYIAMDNCPHQAVIVGTKAAAEQAVEQLQKRGLIYEALPFDRPYHTPLFRAYADASPRQFFAQLPISAPKVPIYSCTTAALYPSDLAEIGELFVEHWVRPVRFRETIQRMHSDGVRIFVEVGPRGNLTGFVDDILRGLPHFALPSNAHRVSGITQLNHLCAQLAAQGVPMRLDYLYARRAPCRLPWNRPEVAGDRRTDARMKLALGVPQLRVSPRERTSEKPAPVGPASVATKERAGHDHRPVPVPALTGAPSGAPAPRDGVGRRSSAPAMVMEDYMGTMDRFLGLQQRVMEAFLARSTAATSHRAPGPVAAPSAAPPPRGLELDASHASTRDQTLPGLSSYPLLGTVTTLVPGQELVARRRLDRQEDLFLREHALGGRISLTDETLLPLSIVPLTMSMEMLAEAASALMPDRMLIGMREVRAHRWIPVDDEPVTVSITARRRSPTGQEVDVEIRNASAGEGALEPPPQEPVLMEGVMIFGDAYPEQPPPANVSLDSESISRLASLELYDGKLMFHGPCFQGVASVDRSGRNGLVGRLRVLKPGRLFRSDSSPRFVTDPVVLDAAGQLVGYWTAEHLERGFVVFPYRLEALDIHGPNRTAGERVTCRLRPRLMGTSQIRSDLDLVDSDGRVWMRLVGWEDSRFDLPERFHRFWVSPGEATMAQSWRSPLARTPEADSLECFRLEPPFETANPLWKDLWASLVLNRNERSAFRASNESPRRRSEWLLGRTAAKDAVRAFLKKHRQTELLPADIEIGLDDEGRPVPRGPWTREMDFVPALSLAHVDGMAVGVAGQLPNGRRLGVDLERRPRPDPGLGTEALRRGEQESVACFPVSDRNELEIRSSCAQGAVARALGLDSGGREYVRVLEVDGRTGVVKVGLDGRIARALPELAGAEIVVNTSREGEYIFAITTCEASSS